MFIDEPEGDLIVRPKLSYQIMLGAFSVALVLFGVWWPPIIEWTHVVAEVHAAKLRLGSAGPSTTHGESLATMRRFISGRFFLVMGTANADGASSAAMRVSP